jgi:hypothetical protein
MLNFKGLELRKRISNKDGDRGGRNDRACNPRPSRGNGQRFAYPEVSTVYRLSVFLSDMRHENAGQSHFP